MQQVFQNIAGSSEEQLASVDEINAAAVSLSQDGRRITRDD